MVLEGVVHLAFGVGFVERDIPAIVLNQEVGQKIQGQLRRPATDVPADITRISGKPARIGGLVDKDIPRHREHGSGALLEERIGIVTVTQIEPLGGKIGRGMVAPKSINRCYLDRNVYRQKHCLEEPHGAPASHGPVAGRGVGDFGQGSIYGPRYRCVATVLPVGIGIGSRGGPHVVV